MRFLIDECLHTSLGKVAHEAGYLCEHVNFLGLSGQKDWELMPKVQAGEYTFVTNNRTDFAVLYTQEELHAGLVINRYKRSSCSAARPLPSCAIAYRRARPDKRRAGSRYWRRDDHLPRVSVPSLLTGPRTWSTPR